MYEDQEYVLPEVYTFTPLKALRVASRQKLSRFLDEEGDIVEVNNDSDKSEHVNDYSGLAELAGFNYQDYTNMKKQKSPTTELLDKWTDRNGTVGNLWMYLFLMERLDVLTDCRRTILQDCSIYERNQQLKEDAEKHKRENDHTATTSEMRIDETKFATKQDVNSGTKTSYDAFICWSPEDEKDRKFLFELITELEVNRGLKLFVPGRDDLPGSAEQTITAYLIEMRCRRVVILMSRTFLQSSACDFQVKFAHALAPGARSKRLIPVIREKNIPIPRILRFLAFCDFTKHDIFEWVWDRLYSAVTAPVEPITYFEPEDTSNPFEMVDISLKELAFPRQPRLEEYGERVGYQPKEAVEYSVSSMSSISNEQSLVLDSANKMSQKGTTGNKAREEQTTKVNKKEKKRESGSKIFRSIRDFFL